MYRANLLIIGLMLIGASCGAAAADGLEFSPFTGYRFGGSFEDSGSDNSLDVDDTAGWGFTVSQTASKTTRYEFLYSHQDTSLADSTDPNNAFDLDIHYLHLGGAVDVYQDRFTPYITGGLGMTFMNPGHRGYDDETRFSMSVGGGLKWYPTERLGIRFEMRGYSTLVNSNGSLFCDGGCNLQINGDIFPQFETNLGLIFRF
ncbi:MAG: porin family protein [Candidatus Thiodiazotropha sp. (ex Epidulcina cf. delphinae)]|nr:porin family protein [Candidatus Thiodiazotropha sp. (ex Epidulcina cf. delphinae)]